MPQTTVTGPDGKSYQFPSDATDQEILAFFKAQEPKTIAQPHSIAPEGTVSVITGKSQEPSTLDRIGSTIAAAPGNMLRGLKSLVTTDPRTTLANEGARIADRLGKSWDAAKTGNIPEAAGQAMAAIPVLGEMGAQPAEQARSGHPVEGVTNLGINMASLAAPDALQVGMSRIPLRGIGNRLVASATDTTPDVAAQMTERGAGRLSKANTDKLASDPAAQPRRGPSVPSQVDTGLVDASGKPLMRDVQTPGPMVPGSLTPAVDAHRAAVASSGGARGMVTDAVKGGVAGEFLKDIPVIGSKVRAVLAPVAAATHDFTKSAVGQGLVTAANSGDVIAGLVRAAIIASLAKQQQTQPVR